jgi:formaldehyde-activating enzyme involved in methanogenesis
MNATALSATMRAAMLAVPAIGAVDGPALTALCNAIATTVVAHVTTFAVVTPTLMVAPTGGGPVTGTGTVS